MNSIARYSQADLQRVKTALILLRNSGQTTIDQAIGSIDGLVRARHAEVVEHARSRQLSSKSDAEICPSCGRGLVHRWRLISAEIGADVYGCKSCMWSEVR
jgi:predicted RNA-binding Zn-ribbon protein involved in translation (DUF1610 family)